MPNATYTLKIDWNNDGDYSDTGEDVTARLLHLQWGRGRDFASQLTGRSISGQLVAILNNESGDYSSFNTSSPLTGNLLPGRKVRLDGGSGSFPYTFPIVFNDKPHFVGFIDKIEPLPDVNGPNKVKITAIGALGYLNQKKISLAMSTSVLTGTAIGNILTEAGWPSADRDLDTGQTTIDRFWIDRENVINALRKVEELEGGFIVEDKDGKIRFEDRHDRTTSPHTTSQATFSDASGAARSYSRINQVDPFPFIFNEFEAIVQLYTVGTLAVLWTLSESGGSSPLLAPGQSRDFWAQYPNPDSATNAVAVNAWTTPVATTDYTANSQSGGGGTNLTADLTVTVSKFAQTMKISITNGAAVEAYITLLQARGTPVTADDPVRIVAEDSTSQTRYGERTFKARQIFGDSGEALDWVNFNLGIYKDPIPLLEITVNANRSHNHLVEVLTRDISDRVTIVANGDAGLGINRDFFIEGEKHVVDAHKIHWVTWKLSPVTGYNKMFVLDTSTLDGDFLLGF